MTVATTDTILQRCGCGECGIEFETPVRAWGRTRTFAPDCPVRGARVREANRRSARETYARVRSTRRCQCGCGRVLPPFVWYHPECESRAKVHRDGTPGERAPGKRCRVCEGQSWRRDERCGCYGCGLPYAPEKPPPRAPEVGSALGDVP